MQLPSIERTPGVRPAADSASSGANRVIPVAPVNPTVSPSPPLEPSPGVVNHVNPALQGTQSTTPTEGAPVYTSVPDPMKNSAAAQQTPHDWTIHRPAPEKVETPPAKPISQVLLDHLKTMWTASASAVQIEQVKDQLTTPPPASSTQPVGQVAQEALTYQPTKIKKTGSI